MKSKTGKKWTNFSKTTRYQNSTKMKDIITIEENDLWLGWVGQLAGASPIHQRFVGLSPNQGTYMGYSSIPVQGTCVAVDQCFSLTFSQQCFSLSQYVLGWSLRKKKKEKKMICTVKPPEKRKLQAQKNSQN